MVSGDAVNGREKGCERSSIFAVHWTRWMESRLSRYDFDADAFFALKISRQKNMSESRSGWWIFDDNKSVPMRSLWPSNKIARWLRCQASSTKVHIWKCSIETGSTKTLSSSPSSWIMNSNPFSYFSFLPSCGWNCSILSREPYKSWVITKITTSSPHTFLSLFHTRIVRNEKEIVEIL